MAPTIPNVASTDVLMKCAASLHKKAQWVLHLQQMSSAEQG